MWNSGPSKQVSAPLSTKAMEIPCKTLWHNTTFACLTEFIMLLILAVIAPGWAGSLSFSSSSSFKASHWLTLLMVLVVLRPNLILGLALKPRCCPPLLISFQVFVIGLYPFFYNVHPFSPWTFISKLHETL